MRKLQYLFSIFIATLTTAGIAHAQNDVNGVSNGGYEGSGIIYGAPTYTAPDYGTNSEATTTEPVYQNNTNTTIIRETVPVPVYVYPPSQYNNYNGYNGYPNNQPYPYGQIDNGRRDTSRRIGGPLNPTRTNPTFAPNAQPDASNSNNRSFQDRRTRGPNFNERLDRRMN